MTETPEPLDRESINLAEYIWLIRQGKWIILAFVVVSMAASIYITMRTAPVYQSSATFIYNMTNSMTQTLNFPGVFWFQMEPQKNNQIQIIRSRSMAESVADSVLRSPDSDSLVALLFNGSIPESPYLRSALVSLAAGNVAVAVMKDTDFFILSTTGSTPAASAALANLVVQTYYRRNLEDVRGENREIRQFLEDQLSTMEQQLLSDEQILRDYKEENQLIDLGTEAQELVSSLIALETQASGAETNLGAMESTRDYLSSRAQSFRDDLASELEGLNSSSISSLQSDLALLEGSRASLIARGAAPDDPALQDLELEIGSRRSALAEALAGVAAATFPSDPTGALQGIMSELVSTEAGIRAERTREAVLRRLASEIDARLSDLPEAEMNLARLERNRTVSENVYILMRTKYEEIRIAEAGQIGNVTIIDTALPGGLVRPSRQRNLAIGFIVGLALGIGTVFLRERLDTSLSSPEQIEAMGVSVLGVIPKMKRLSSAPYSARTGMSTSLVTYFAPRDPVSEAYRDLRTGLRFSRADHQVKTILVTSAGPREGKSTTSANMAIAFAQAGQKCLLVDADLRRPVAHNLFNVEREPGLSEAVAGVAPIEKCIHSTEVENLSVIPCGFIPHNPSELLGSRKLRDLIADLSTRWEIIIFDSPPVAVVTDALLLSPEFDGTLMVVGAKLGNKRVVQTALTKLTRSSAFVVGAVLNGFDPLRMYTSYGYYTYRYYYYYSDGRRAKSHKRGTSSATDSSEA
jgi:capsular exopolysaccharide synthesis family protein